MAQLSPMKPRLHFIDNLRWLMIILVVLVHVNVTYSNLGSWYYREQGSIDLFSRLVSGLFGSFTQAFFMGFLFFISGYFVPAAYDRKGFGGFIRGRLFRLGIPTLVYMLVIHPLTIVIMNHYQHWNLNLLDEYKKYLINLKFIGESGPLWFALALLIFSLFYAFIKKAAVLVSPNPMKSDGNKPINHGNIIALIAVIAVIAFSIRLVQPIGTSVLNMQLCFFSQYIVLFITGIFAARRGWMDRINPQFGQFWLKLAVFGGFTFWALIMFFGGSIHGNLDLYFGGVHWQSVAYALWESFFAVAFSLGLWVWFRERFNKQGRLARFLSDNAFGVYVFHAPILVLISMLLRDVTIYPLLKAVMVGAIAVPVSFGVSYLLRKIPGLKTVFS